MNERCTLCKFPVKNSIRMFQLLEGKWFCELCLRSLMKQVDKVQKVEVKCGQDVQKEKP